MTVTLLQVWSLLQNTGQPAALYTVPGNAEDSIMKS
jgi:hypothetical protein